jgi:hypothetical protein
LETKGNGGTSRRDVDAENPPEAGKESNLDNRGQKKDKKKEKATNYGLGDGEVAYTERDGYL